jgi:hypothetical protein
MVKQSFAFGSSNEFYSSARKDKGMMGPASHGRRLILITNGQEQEE